MERHEAIVAGAGPAGLAVAARLKGLGVETLVLERTDQVGARWRKRYRPLRLNTMRQFSSLPGFRIPRRYGRYPRREDFISYLEEYAERQGLDIRFGTSLDRVEREGEESWRLETSAGPMLCRYAVVATGYDAVPVMPEWPGAESFTGELIHVVDYTAPEPYEGKEVLVVGAGNTGVDIAGHLIDAGATVSIAMRTPPNIFPREMWGMPLQPTAIVLDRLPSKIGDSVGWVSQRVYFGNLEPYGIPKPPEGFMTKFRTTLVGAAVDDGFVKALKKGRARVVPPVERFEGDEVVLTGGERMRPAAVLAATGYRRGLEPIAGHLGVLRPDGLPIAYNAAPEHPAAPRLYFAGFWGGNSGQIRIMPIHARRIARAVRRDRRRAPRTVSRPRSAEVPAGP